MATIRIEGKRVRMIKITEKLVFRTGLHIIDKHILPQEN